LIIPRGDGVKALDQEQIAGEARLQPRAGDRVQAGGKTLTWKEHHSAERHLDFSAIYRDPGNFKLAYTVCYVHADADRDDLVLRVGSDDQARICLNGEEIYWQPHARGLELDHDEIPIVLRKGPNVLVFKVINQGGPGPHGSVHITTKNGDAAEGIECRLTPE